MLLELVKQYKPYIMPLAVSCAMHVGIASYGGFSIISDDPQAQFKNGQSVVELTLMPSAPSKASVEAKKVLSAPAEQQENNEAQQPEEQFVPEDSPKKSDQAESAPVKTIEPENIECACVDVASAEQSQQDEAAKPQEEPVKDAEPENPVTPCQAPENISEKEKEQVNETSPVNQCVNSVESPLIEADTRTKGVSCECEMTSELVVKYPRVSRRKNEEGTVDLKLAIDEQGRVTKVDIINSSGYKRLDKSAVKSMKTARFTPAMKNGENVKSELTMNITFKLDDLYE